MSKQLSFIEVVRLGRDCEFTDKGYKYRLKGDQLQLWSKSQEEWLTSWWNQPLEDNSMQMNDKTFSLIEEPEKVVVCWFKDVHDGEVYSCIKHGRRYEDWASHHGYKLIKEETIEVIE